LTVKVLLVAGARPNFMKVAPVIAALEGAAHECTFVHTGQHYDAVMSDAFIRDLGLRAPDYHLGVGSGSHALQTARIMEAFEPVVVAERPDWVVVVGDVNSTLACALVASKLAQETGCRIAHVEAGLRSNDWLMPEEINRVLTDRLSDLLLTPSRDALANLTREGIDSSRVVFVGNVMIDSLLRMLPQARGRGRGTGTGGHQGLNGGPYAIATLHRPSNVDDRESLTVILSALADLSADLSVVLPLHPRTRARIDSFGLEGLLAPLVATPPLGYMDMLALQADAEIVITDSGGMQEESTVLGVPCVTLRRTTERPVTVSQGTNRLAPWPLTRDGIVRTALDARRSGRVEIGARAPEGWDGHASERIVTALEKASATTERK